MSEKQQPQKPEQPPAGEAPKTVPQKPPPPDITKVKGSQEIGDKIVSAVPPRPKQG